MNGREAPGRFISGQTPCYRRRQKGSDPFCMEEGGLTLLRILGYTGWWVVGYPLFYRAFVVEVSMVLITRIPAACAASRTGSPVTT